MTAGDNDYVFKTEEDIHDFAAIMEKYDVVSVTAETKMISTRPMKISMILPQSRNKDEFVSVTAGDQDVIFDRKKMTMFQ